MTFVVDFGCAYKVAANAALRLCRGERIGKLAAGFANGADKPTFPLATRALRARTKIKDFSINANFAINFYFAGANLFLISPKMNIIQQKLQ